MKKFIYYLLILFLLIPLNVSASNPKELIAMDMESKRVLYTNNATEKSLIASITKIMTSVVTMDIINVNKTVTAKDEVLKMYGSNIYIEYGEKMKVKDLLYGLLLRSGNDAAVVLANNVSKNEKSFVKLMNKKAQSIGMKNTIFSNCHGLDEETKNYSTAYDMALLSSYAYNNYPLYKKNTGTYKYEVQTKDKSYLWINRNKLLKMYKYATGGKTGYTPSAGRTLVTTASKDNFNVTIVSLDDSDFYNTHKNLYNDIYNNYKYYKIIDKHHLNMDNTFYKDNIYVKKSFSYPLTNEEKDNIKIKLKLTKIKHYKNNEKVGVIDIYLNNNKIKQVAVFVHKKKENKNLFSKIFSS